MSFILFVFAFLVYFAMLAFCFTRFESRHHPARYFIFFSLPAVILIFLCAVIYFHPIPRGDAGDVSARWLFLHVGLILLGLAGLLTAVSSAVMYLIQRSQLKSKHPDEVFFKLPSLDALDRVNFISLVWGILFFSLGMVSGVLWAGDLNALTKAFYDKKVILSAVTCIMYWTILWLRASSLRRGHKIAVGTVFVFLLLFLTIVSTHDLSLFSGS